MSRNINQLKGNYDMRKRLYEIIEVASPNDKISIIYDKIMILSIIVSIIPIAFKQHLFSLITQMHLQQLCLLLIIY